MKRITEAAKILSEEIQKVLANGSEEDISNLVSAVTAKRPKGWSSKTVVTYYNEHSAIDLKSILDGIFHKLEHEDFIIKAEDQRLSSGSLHQKVTQAWLYLTERMDETNEEYPQGKYRWLREHVEVQKERGLVRLKWKGIRGGILIAPEQADIHAGWKRKLIEFIETAEENQKLELHGLNLGPPEILFIQNLINNSDVFHIMNLKKSTFKIAKKTFQLSSPQDNGTNA